MKKKFWGLTSLVGAAAAIAVAFVVVPALGEDAYPEGAVVYDAASFVGFVDSDDPTARQPLTNGSGCLIADPSGSLVALSGDGNGYKGPGLVSTSIGIKSGGSNGTPCSFTEFKPNEQLVVTSTAGAWDGLELDLELKDNAWVVLTLGGGTSDGETFELVSGASIVSSGASSPVDMELPYEAKSTGPGPVACADPSDSGPDSGANDNCRWIIDPGVSFTSFTISMKNGNVSLEGGADDTSLLEPTYFFYAQFAAVDDPFDTNEDTKATFDVLENDVAVGADPNVVFTFPTSVTVGEATVDLSGAFDTTGLDAGEFEFDPSGLFEFLNDGDSAIVSFTYTADGETATVTITVGGVNDAPKLDPDLCSEQEDGSFSCSATTDEDTPKKIQLATDVDDDTLNIQCPDDRVDDSATDGSIVFTPLLDDDADAEFSCTVADLEVTITVGVTVTVNPVNDPPVAIDDPETGTINTMNERKLEIDPNDSTKFVSSPVTASFDVVSNDTDVDDANGVLKVDDVGQPEGVGLTFGTGGTTVDVSEDGRSIEFTPVVDWDVVGAFEVEVTIPYAVQDDEFASDVVGQLDGDEGVSEGVLTVTVKRVVCSAETVTASDSSEGLFASGSFTLLSDQPICKDYSTSANAAEKTVTFVPGTGDPARFLGELTFTPTALQDGTFTAGLEYDPGDGFRPIKACLNPVFEAGEFVSAEFPLKTADPADGTESWCLVQVIGTATGPDGALEPVFILYGEEDPTFKFR